MHPRLRPRATLLALAVLLLAGCGDSDSPSKSPAATETTATAASAPELGPSIGSMDDLPGVLKTSPPWDRNGAELQQRLRAIGLPALTAEGEVVHTHQHLELFVDGEPVAVPDDIGVGQAFISPLHTHAGGDGVLHVESPTATSYTLGQFFAVWGVRLDAKCIGGKCAGEGKELRTWVNGRPVEGDPTRILLADHQEIVIAYGTPDQMPDPVPSSYAFPEGL
jgi:hypothetical protein